MKADENQKLIDFYYTKYEMKQFLKPEYVHDLRLFRFEKNEYICKEEEELEYFFFFVKGKAKLSRSLPNGRTVMLAFYHPFSMVGDIEVVKNQNASCTMQTLTSSQCLGLPMKLVRNQLSGDSDFLHFLCESLANKLYIISMNSTTNMIYPLENRLAAYIHETMIQVSVQGRTCYYFDEPLVNVAEWLATSYRHLLRTLADYVSQGILVKENQRYEILDRKALVDLSCNLYQDAIIHHKGM